MASHHLDSTNLEGEDHGHDRSASSTALEDEAIELIKESLAASEGETDYDASVTHAFIVLGASVSWNIKFFHSFSLLFLQNILSLFAAVMCE